MSEHAHPTSETLRRFLDGQLTSRDAESIALHLRSCHDCGRLLESLAEQDHSDEVIQSIATDWLDGHPKCSGTGSTPKDESRSRAVEPESTPLAPYVPGQFVGVYQLEAFLGSGGNGAVYRGVQREPVRRKVAIKFAHHPIPDGAANHRIALEREALASLRHPAIPQFYDAGITAQQIPYFVMEYCEGAPLTRILKRGPLSLDVGFPLISQVCGAVEHAHRNGVIHRDLKPSNILVGSDDSSEAIDTQRVKVIDFGIARLIHADRDRDRLTRDHELIGTLSYISPEQLLLRKPCDTRGDVYSLGVMLYEMLTGRLPYAGSLGSLGSLGSPDSSGTMSIDVATQLVGELDPPTPSRAAVKTQAQHSAAGTTQPSKLRGEPDWIVMKAIERNPERRYQSAGELAEDIRRYLEGEVISAGPPSRTRFLLKWARRHRALCAMMLVFVAFVVLTGLVITGQNYRLFDRNTQLAWRTYVGEMQLAEGRFRLGHNQAAIDILQRLRRDTTFDELRGIEGDLLWKQTHPESLIDEVELFADQIDDLAVDTPGTQLAAISRKFQIIRLLRVDPTGLRLEETITADQIRTQSPVASQHWVNFDFETGVPRPYGVPWGYQPHPLMTCVRFSPSSPVLAIGTYSGAVILWDLRTDQVLRRIDCPEARISRIEYSPDGRQIAVLGSACWLIDVRLGEATLVFDDVRTFRGDFNADGSQFVAAGYTTDRSLHFIDTRSKNRTATHSVMIPVSSSSTIGDVQFAPDGRSVINTLSNSGIYLRTWDGESLGEPTLIGSTRNGARSIRFDASGTRLASTCDGGLLQYWDIVQRRSIDSIVGHTGQLNCLAYSMAADAFLCGGQEGVLRMYHGTFPSRTVRLPRGAKDSCMGVHPDGSLVAIGFVDGTVVLRNSSDLSVIDRLETDHGSAHGMGFMPDGKTLCVIFRSGAVAFWRLDTDRVRWFRRDSVALRLCSTGDDRAVAVTYRDGVVIVVNDDGNEQLRFQLPERQSSLDWDHCRGRFLGCWGRGNLNHYDARGNVVAQVPIDPNVRVVIPLYRGDDVIGYGAMGTLVRLNADTGQVRHGYRGHVGLVTKVLRLDGGDRLMSVANDFTARIWHTESGDEILLKEANSRHYRRINTDSGGRLIAINYSNRVFEVIDLRESPLP